MATRNESASTTIQAPPSVVFDILADPRQHARIDGSGTVKRSISGPDRLELGSQFGMDMKLGAPYKIKNKVVEFERDRLIAWRHIGLHRWRYELRGVQDGGTHVTETWDVTAYPAPIQALLHRVFGARTKTAVEQTMVKLKDAAEADAAS